LCYKKLSISFMEIVQGKRSWFLVKTGMPGGFILLLIRAVREDFVMRNLRAIFAMNVMAFFLSVPAIAGEDPMAGALEHAAKAKAHGDGGRTKELMEHAEQSLRHARASEKRHAAQRNQMAQAVKHLEQAIEQGKAGRARVANKHMGEALVRIRRSTSD
jgi:hypothetical protein